MEGLSKLLHFVAKHVAGVLRLRRVQSVEGNMPNVTLCCLLAIGWLRPREPHI